jgi:hypothetical protein
VQVHYPLFEPVEGEYANYTDCYYDAAGKLMCQLYQNFTYQNYISPHQINVTCDFTDWDYNVSSGRVYRRSMIVDTMNRLVIGGGWTNFWYPLWIETNISQGSTVNLWDEPQKVTASRLFKNTIDCWEIPYYTWYGKLVPLYDKASGLMIKNEYVYRPSPIFDIRLPYYREVLSLVGTDIQISTGKRQIAVVDLTCPRTFVRQNLTVPIKVTVENQGVYPETANITVFASSTPLSSQTCWLDIGDSLELNCDWNTAGFAYGNYTLEAMATLLEQANTSSGYSGGWIIVSDPPVASFNWSPSLPRTSESITFDALSSSAGWNDTNTLVLYSWDFGDGNITVTPSALTTHVYAVAMAYDVSLMVTDSGDMTDLTWREVRVKVMGDINNDDTVNMGDIVILVNGFGSYPGHSRWNTVADLDQNQRIDLHDIVIALLNFGKTYRT